MKKIIITTKLTESLEDYLEAILELTEIEGHAHTKKIADKLKVRMPSVTVALRQLAARKLITYSVNYPVELTEAGRAEAQRILGRHKFLKVFFADILGLPPAKASETACRLEHIVDEDIINRFVQLAERLTADGKVLPLCQGNPQSQDPQLAQGPAPAPESMPANQPASVTEPAPAPEPVPAALEQSPSQDAQPGQEPAINQGIAG